MTISCAGAIAGGVEEVKDLTVVGSPLEGHPVREEDWGCNCLGPVLELAREKN